MFFSQFNLFTMWKFLNKQTPGHASVSVCWILMTNLWFNLVLNVGFCITDHRTAITQHDKKLCSQVESSIVQIVFNTYWEFILQLTYGRTKVFCHFFTFIVTYTRTCTVQTNASQNCSLLQKLMFQTESQPQSCDTWLHYFMQTAIFINNIYGWFIEIA